MKKQFIFFIEVATVSYNFTSNDTKPQENGEGVVAGKLSCLA
jgi:hypothetical protein